MKIFSTLKKHAESFLEPYKQQEPATYAAAEQAIGAVLITDGFIGIDNPFGGKKRPGIFGTVAGVLFGVLFLFIPTIFGNMSGINKMTATTQATVVSVGMNTNTNTNTTSRTRSSNNSPSCSLTARYTVDGKEYTKQASTSSSGNCGLSEGQTVTINYDPANPASWTKDAKTTGIALQAFFWIGILMIISSLITFIIRLLSIIYGWKILKDGRKLAETLPQGTNLETMINEIKQGFIGKVFNFGGGMGAAVGGIGGLESMVSSMTNPTAQPPTQPAPPAQQTPQTQQPEQPIQNTQPPVQPAQPTPPAPQTDPAATAYPTSEPTTIPEPQASEPAETTPPESEPTNEPGSAKE
ncbi:MAG: DUF3592 domain-containing protein [bacterium]|nr:DUF3592 domain-containing protein [bacterium]